MREEKTKETKIREAEAKIWCEYGLERPTNSPKICDLKPARTAAPHRHDHNHHSPIAKLERQHLLPTHYADVADKNQIDSVIQHEQGGERCHDHTLEAARFCPTHYRRQGRSSARAQRANSLPPIGRSRTRQSQCYREGSALRWAHRCDRRRE